MGHGLPSLSGKAQAWQQDADVLSCLREPLVDDARGRQRRDVEIVHMWSPQLYLDRGRNQGCELEVLNNAICQIERVIVPHPEIPAILSLNHLAQRVGVSYQGLRAIAERHQNPYRHFSVRKRSGGLRRISVPSPELMRVQRWLAVHVLNPLAVHHSSYAFKPGSSIVKCASRHCGARWLVKMDIAGFFSSISEIQIYRVFRALGYQGLVAFELARLTTHSPGLSPRYTLATWRGRGCHEVIPSYNNAHLGYLPQGAPTSPMLSNLIMCDADAKIESVAKTFGLNYTRYSDDLTFSTRGNDFTRSRATRLVANITLLLARMGLYPQERKTKIVPPGARKVVLGLIVDGATPTLAREFRSLLRQHLYYLESVGPIEHAKKRGFETVWGMHSYIRGLIDFAKMVDRPYADRILARFVAIDWPL